MCPALVNDQSSSLPLLNQSEFDSLRWMPSHLHLDYLFKFHYLGSKAAVDP